MTKLYSWVAAMEEIVRILGGNAESVTYEGKRETYRRGGKAVELERELWFDDEEYNSYVVKEVST